MNFMSYKIVLLLLLYVFQSSLELTKKSLKFQRLVVDFSYDVERKISLSSNFSDFKYQVLSDSLSMPPACYKLRSRFIRFVEHSLKICESFL